MGLLYQGYDYLVNEAMYRANGKAMEKEYERKKEEERRKKEELDRRYKDSDLSW